MKTELLKQSMHRIMLNIYLQEAFLPPFDLRSELEHLEWMPLLQRKIIEEIHDDKQLLVLAGTA